MREFLFRGRRVDNGDWTYGTPFQEYSDFWGEWEWIIQTEHPLTNEPNMRLQIDRKTVGQSTGLTDKNGKKIFEGDIVEFESHGYIPSVEKGVVLFRDGCYGIEYLSDMAKEYGWEKSFHRIGKIDHWMEMGASGQITYTYEVVGNIHDNPELLEGGAEYGKR